MPVGYRSGGADFDDLFDPDVVGNGPTVAAPGMRSGGAPLRYAALQYGSKRANIGYRGPNGQDVTNLWAAKGTAQYALPFDGAVYSTHTTGTTGQTGDVAGTTTFTVNPNGTFFAPWQSGNPQTGSVLLGGGPVSEYSYRIVTISQSSNYPAAGFSGYVSNSATALAAVSAGARSVFVSVSGPANSEAQDNFITASLRFELYRNGALVSQSTFRIEAIASGWQ